MSLLHCPLCIGLAVLSVGRAAAHLALALLSLPQPLVPVASAQQAIAPA